MDGFWIALVGVVGAVLGAVLSSWLAGRAKAADAVRDVRLKAYPLVWEQTSVVSRWPHTDANWAHLSDLQLALRTWYYETGGLYLSENARRRFGSLQELLAAMLDHSKGKVDLAAAEYVAVMEEASAFRSALTEDLQSREQHSLVSLVRRAVQHRTQQSAALRRRRSVLPAPPAAATSPAPPAPATSSGPAPTAGPAGAPPAPRVESSPGPARAAGERAGTEPRRVEERAKG